MELLIFNRKYFFTLVRFLSISVILFHHKEQLFSNFYFYKSINIFSEIIFRIFADLIVVKLISQIFMTDMRKLFIFNNPAHIYSIYFLDFSLSIIYFLVFVIFHYILKNKFLYTQFIILFLFIMKGIFLLPVVILNSIYFKNFIENIYDKLIFYLITIILILLSLNMNFISDLININLFNYEIISTKYNNNPFLIFYITLLISLYF